MASKETNAAHEDERFPAPYRETVLRLRSVRADRPVTERG